jgi:hypothetical protein
MPGSISSMHLEHVLRDVQLDRGGLLHGRFSAGSTPSPWHADAGGASTRSPNCDIGRAGSGRQLSDPTVDLERTGSNADKSEAARRRKVLMGGKRWRVAVEVDHLGRPINLTLVCQFSCQVRKAEEAGV